ncbi:unnamed protein product, partial [marine sediment metagenome]
MLGHGLLPHNDLATMNPRVPGRVKLTTPGNKVNQPTPWALYHAGTKKNEPPYLSALMTLPLTTYHNTPLLT